MKHLFILSAFLLGFQSSHAQDSVLPKGGMSGGGGGTMVLKPVGEAVAFATFEEARTILTSYFYYKQGVPHAEDLKPYPGVVQVMNQIIPKIHSVGIEKERTQSCLDAQGMERDASIYSRIGSGKICVSTFNLGKKLTKENVYSQSIALLAHEYAHLVGADEALAEEVQREVIFDLAGGSVRDYYYQTWPSGAAMLSMNFYGGSGWKIRGSGDSELFISKLYDDAVRFYPYPWIYKRDFPGDQSKERYGDRSYSIWTPAVSAEYANIFLEIFLLNETVNGNQRYEAFFGSKTEISAWELAQFLETLPFPASFPQAGKTFMISKVVDQATYEKEMLSLANRLHALTTEVQTFMMLEDDLRGK